MLEFLAHISSDGRKQSVLEHLHGTAVKAAEFASAFGAEEQGQLAGMAHDIGKYSAAFQRRIQGAAEQVDHSTAGAAECAKINEPYAAFAVMGHHGGLPDGGSRTDSIDSPTFSGRLQRAAKGKLADYSAWQSEIHLPKAALPLINQRDPKEIMFFIRMLYSCLTDADFLDTAEFMDGRKTEPCADSTETLAEKLDHFCESWFPPKTPLNQQRCAILRKCQQQGDLLKPGLFSLTVPTGGGKTVSSMAFALHHAKAHGLKRIVYVVPYTSIIEQNADVFRKILGDANVLEHHSGVLYDVGEEATPESVRMAKAAENWDIPIVVTTAVQFFESLFSNRPSQCRKLHSLAQSVIVFDEAQMLPVTYLRPCVYAISQLIKNYRASAVLCTATQPALGKIFQEFLPDFPQTEICPEGTVCWKNFRRSCFQKLGTLSHTELADRLMEQNQALCIVNTRKSARTIWGELEPEGAYHLSTLMYPEHRRAVLEEIRSRLKNGLPCRVVSTSLIEAGVDVDFPAVFREESGLDSILQAAGRCNREGKRPAAESVVTIFRGEDAPPSLFSIPIAAGRQTISKFEELDSKEAIFHYFQELLDLKGKDAQDQKKILSLIQSGAMPFRTIAEQFHLIESGTRTVYIPKGEGAEYAQRLRLGERSRSLFRKLGQYGVSVYEQHFQALYDAGDLELLDGETAVLTNLALYREATGLSLEADNGKAEFI